MTENLSKKTAENARSQCKTNCKDNVSCLDKEKDIERDKYNTVGRKFHIIIYSTLFYSILIYSILFCGSYTPPFLFRSGYILEPLNIYTPFSTSSMDFSVMKKTIVSPTFIHVSR
nr:MAG TPA: hypothetical protein [Caudoviricetes sp.]